MQRTSVIRLVAALSLAPLAVAQNDNPAAGKDAAPSPANLVGPGPLTMPAAQAAGQPNSQGTTFVTPGMPTLGRRVSSGQVTRFTNDFNPAFSFIVDAQTQVSEAEFGDDGADAFLRVFELGANAWVDPNAWAYFVAVAEDEGIGSKARQSTAAAARGTCSHRTPARLRAGLPHNAGGPSRR